MAPGHLPGHSRKEGGVTLMEKMPVTHPCQKISSHSCFIWTHLLLHSVDAGGHLLYARGTCAAVKIPGLLVPIGR